MSIIDYSDSPTIFENKVGQYKELWYGVPFNLIITPIFSLLVPISLITYNRVIIETERADNEFRLDRSARSS